MRRHAANPKSAQPPVAAVGTSPQEPAIVSTIDMNADECKVRQMAIEAAVAGGKVEPFVPLAFLNQDHFNSLKSNNQLSFALQEQLAAYSSVAESEAA